MTTVTACWVQSINCRLSCEWRPTWSSVNASSIQSWLIFVTVSIGSRSVQESTSSWVSSFTNVSMALLLDTSRRCLIVQKSTVPALSRLCSTARGDLLVPRTKTKPVGPRSFATSGSALWNNLPDDLRDPSLSLTVFKHRLKSYLFKQCWCAIQPKLTFAATLQLMHLHSSMRSFASKEVTFTLH